MLVSGLPVSLAASLWGESTLWLASPGFLLLFAIPNPLLNKA